MPKQTRESLSRDIALLKEFRGHLERVEGLRAKLKQLKQQVEENWMMGMDLNAAENMQKNLDSQLMDFRREVMKRIPDVMNITGRYPLPTVLRIMPPRLLGGYVHSVNIFQAFVELQLPYDMELDPIKVFDLVDQAIWACERDLRQFANANPSPAPTEEVPDTPRAAGVQGEPGTQSPTLKGSTSWTGCGTLLTVFASLASVIGIVGLIGLLPKPSIDRDISLDENNPFEVQFRVRNSSPFFDLYNVSPACELVKVEIGNSIFTNNTLVHPEMFQPRLPAGGATTFTCRLPPPFKTESIPVFKTGEVILRVDYRLFNRISSSVRQRIVLTHDKAGKPVWLFEGLKD